MEKNMERFYSFIKEIVSNGDWEYGDGTPMTNDANEFITYFEKLKDIEDKKLSNIKIERLYDEYNYEDCGYSVAYGANVYIDGKLELEFKPIVHRYNSKHYKDDFIFQSILKKLGHKIEII
jgi:hypothetical protein